MLNKVIKKVHQVINSQGFQYDADWDVANSGMTEMEMLTEAKEQLVKISAVKPMDLIDKILLVFDVDEKSYKSVQKSTHNYLISLIGNTELRQEVSEVVYEYLRQLYATYTQLIAEYQQENQPILNTEKITLLLARYLNAAFMMSKWRYFEDQAAPLGMWKNLHKVIRFSEGMKTLNRDVFLYDFQSKETSLAALLERGFMLDTLQKGGYTQFQMELSDRVLKAWSTNPKISKQYTKQNEFQFFIYLHEDNRPERLRGAKQHPDFRYWETARIVDLMERYLCAVDTNKPLEAFDLVGLARTEDIVGLFKKLRVDWCVVGYKRQRRNEERSANPNMLNVSHGIDEISARIRYVQPRRGTTNLAFEGTDLSLVSLPNHVDQFDNVMPSSKYGRENWTMLEESSKGFSVELGKDINPWVKSGALVGYSTVDSLDGIALAEIKTVKKRTNGTYRVGLLKITSNPIVRDVVPVQKSTSFEAEGSASANKGVKSQAFIGLLVDDGVMDRSRLIVPRHQHKRANRYRMKINGEDKVVLTGEVVSSHREWVCFDVIV